MQRAARRLAISATVLAQGEVGAELDDPLANEVTKDSAVDRVRSTSISDSPPTMSASSSNAPFATARSPSISTPCPCSPDSPPPYRLRANTPFAMPACWPLPPPGVPRLCRRLSRRRRRDRLVQRSRRRRPRARARRPRGDPSLQVSPVPGAPSPDSRHRPRDLRALWRAGPSHRAGEPSRTHRPIPPPPR